MSKHLPLLATFLCGLTGGTLFSWLSMPLPWILGAITGVLIASKTPLPMAKLPRSFLNVARVVIGLAIGSQFTPDIWQNFGHYLSSLAFLPFYIAAVTFTGWYYFHHWMKLDTRTAFLCSTPGGIAELVLVGEDIKANVAQLALIQGVRILVVVYTLPFLAGSLKDMDVGQARRFMIPFSESDPFALLSVLALGFAGWWVARSVKLSGAPIIGPMITAAVLSMMELLPQEPPDELFKMGQLMLGTSIGCVFFGYGLKDMAKTTIKSLGFLVLLGLITALFAYVVSSVTDFSYLSALLAYAPGGQAETSIISIILQENTGYVALHHLMRLFIIVSLIPIFARSIFKS